MKVRHWDYFLRRQCGKLMIRESGDLLEQVARVFCVILQWALCLLWKNGHGSVMLPWLFVFTGGLLIAVCRPLLIIFPLLFGIDGIMYAGPIADVMAAIVGIVMVVREFKEKEYQIS